jgi:branched-chain amino acid transport system substrate-binding protein
MSFGPDPRKSEAAKEIVEKFRKKNFEPEAYTLYSYAAVQIMAQAAAEAKSTDPQKLAEIMHSGKTFNTVLGDISFDKKGDRTTVDYVMYTWKKGEDGKISYSQN